MVTPPLGAGPLRVTVPVAPLPPATVLGDIETDATESGAVTVSVAEPPAPVQPATLAMTVAVTLLEPEEVVTLKVADVCPAGTVTDAGTCTCELLLCRLTVTPPAGAAAVRVTVPVRPAPPVTELAENATLATQTDGAGGFTVSVADALELPSPAVMVALVVADGTVVVTGNVVDVCPAGTFTLAPT
jgi:hypothetical protein